MVVRLWSESAVALATAAALARRARRAGAGRLVWRVWPFFVFFVVERTGAGRQRRRNAGLGRMQRRQGRRIGALLLPRLRAIVWAWRLRRAPLLAFLPRRALVWA